MSYVIPDLRFEQSFMKQLDNYAGNKRKTDKPTVLNKRNYIDIPTLTDKELDDINEGIDVEEQKELLKPLNPISSSIVIYAIVKDQILMPLLQGFLWTSILLSARPLLGLIVQNGQNAGHWVRNILGLNTIRTRNAMVY